MKLSLRLALPATLLSAAVALAATQITLPGLDADKIAQVRKMGYSTDLASLTNMGLTPALAAFVIVELAAIAVPALRGMRHDREGRRKLRRAALVLSVPLALLMGFRIVKAYLPWMGREGEGWLACYGALLGGAGLLVGLAEIVERIGLTSGYGVVYAAGAIPGLTRWGNRYYPFSEQEPLTSPQIFVIVLGLFLIALLTALVARRPIFAPRAGEDGAPRVGLRAPLSGLVPLVIATALASSLYQFRGAFSSSRDDAERALTFLSGDAGFALLAGAAGAVAFSYLFNSPSRIALLAEKAASRASKKKRGKQRAAQASGGEAAREKRPRRAESGAAMDAYAPPGEAEAEESSTAVVPMTRALVWTGLYLAAIALVGRIMAVLTSSESRTATIALCAAVIADCVATGRFLWKHGAAVSARPEVRPYAVDVCLSALEKETIPAHPRGLSFATMLQFFGMFAPTQVLVPDARGDAAIKALDRAVGSGR